MSEQIHEDRSEFEALAPVYMEILEKLSDNEALKFAFYSIGGFFEDFSQNHELREMMCEKDEDAQRWSEQASDRNRAQRDEERKKRTEHHFSVRAAFKTPLAEEFVGDDGRDHIRLRPGAEGRIVSGFNTGDWWYPRLHEFHDDQGKLIAHAIVGHNNGATSWMIGYDQESDSYCFGSKVHGVSYDPDREMFVGNLGSGQYDLDEMGRNPELGADRRGY